MQKSDSIAALAGALAKAQAVMQGAKKDSENPFFKSKYADLGSVWDACRDALTKNELAVIQTTEAEDEHGSIPVETMLAHSSGEWISGVLKVRPVKDDPQGMGSALTYARRYALSAMVGVAPEEDDGNAASQSGQPQRARTAPRAPKPEPPEHNGGGGTAEPAVKATAEVLALREQIKKAMEALNNAGDDPQWTVERVNKMARESFNGKRTVDLTVHELGDLAQMFIQRLRDINKKGGAEREGILLEIRGSTTEEQIVEWLKTNGGKGSLEDLTLAELKRAETDLTIPF